MLIDPGWYFFIFGRRVRSTSLLVYDTNILEEDLDCCSDNGMYNGYREGIHHNQILCFILYCYELDMMLSVTFFLPMNFEVCVYVLPATGPGDVSKL